MKPAKYTKSGAIRPRYSNAGVSGMFVEIPGSNDYTELPASYYSGGGLSGGQSGSGSTGSGTWNWNSFWSDLTGLGNTFISSYWNKGSDVQAAANYELYKESQKTTYILWAVIGLMLALGVVLLIRKTK